jgi:hypothetical protein
MSSVKRVFHPTLASFLMRGENMMTKLKCWLRTVLLMSLIMGLFWFPVAKADLNDGLVAYYPFSGNYNDNSTNKNDCVSNGVTLTVDRFGMANSASYFDGRSYLNCGNSTLLNVNTHTITAWIKLNRVPLQSHSNVIGKVDPGIHETLSFGVSSDRRLETAFAVGNEINHEINGISSISLDEWHFIALTYDGQKVTFFIDDTIDIRVTRTGIVRTNQNDLAIGRHGGDDYQSGDDNFFYGIIDDVRLYSRILSDFEVRELYQLEFGSSIPVEDTTDDCWAVYENGSLHIPCLKVKGPFGDDLHYEADMQYEPLSEPMTFQVTEAKPK